MMIENERRAMADVVGLVEMKRLLDIQQQQMLSLQRENTQLKKMNAGLRNRLQLVLRSIVSNMQARKQSL